MLPLSLCLFRVCLDHSPIGKVLREQRRHRRTQVDFLVPSRHGKKEDETRSAKTADASFPVLSLPFVISCFTSHLSSPHFISLSAPLCLSPNPLPARQQRLLLRLAGGGVIAALAILFFLKCKSHVLKIPLMGIKV